MRQGGERLDTEVLDVGVGGGGAGDAAPVTRDHAGISSGVKSENSCAASGTWPTGM